MAKRLPNLHSWQWRGYAANHRNSTNLALHLLAVPLFILAALLLLDGVWSLSLTSIAVGVIGLVAALGLQGHGHRLERQPPEPSANRKDAVSRLLMEQFVTFPRFLLSGAWWRAWKERHRH